MKAQTFDEAMKVALSENAPSFSLPKGMRDKMIRALNFSSPLTLGISGPEMMALANKLINKEELNCYEYAVASNNLEARTMIDLGMELEDYLNLMVELTKLAEQFNADTLDIRNAAIAEMAKKNMRSVKN